MTPNFPSHFFFTSEGLKYRVRPIYPSDKKLLQKGFSQLSEKSKYLRLFQIKNKLSDSQLNYFTEVDGIKHVAWGILDESGKEPIPVGIGRFVKYKDEEDVAEVAITVTDSHQGRGLGRLLFATLNYIGGTLGLKTLRHYVLSENHYTLKALEKFNIISQRNEGSVTIVDIGVIPNYKAIPDGNPRMTKFIEALKFVEEEMSPPLR